MFTFTFLSVVLLTWLAHSAHADTVATFSGEGTWYSPETPPLTGIGACGWPIANNDPVVALADVAFYNFPGAVQGNPNANPICGQHIWITYQGKSVVAKVGDRCADCPLPYNVDMTQGLFQLIADLGIGRLKDPGVTWSFVPNDTPLGAATGSPPPPPPGSPTPPGAPAPTTTACTQPTAPPSRRSATFGGEQKRSPQQQGGGGCPPQERRMVKRVAPPQRRGSIESRTTSTMTYERGVTARAAVPQPRSDEGPETAQGRPIHHWQRRDLNSGKRVPQPRSDEGPGTAQGGPVHHWQRRDVPSSERRMTRHRITRQV